MRPAREVARLKEQTHLNQHRVTLTELASHIGAQIDGDPEQGEQTVNRCATLDEAGDGDLSFLSNPKYIKQVESTGASAVVVAPGVAISGGAKAVILRAKNPYHAFTQAMVRLHGYRQHPHAGIHPKAHVDPTASVGEGSVLYPGVFVGPNARVGRDCILYPNVVVYDGCVIGDRVTIHASATIGQDGFGFATNKDADGVVRHHKIPQVGHVRIEDDVEIGAGSTIARGSLSTTVIGQGTKLDSAVVVGHGTKIGAHGLLVAQVGIAGSVSVGKYVTLAGQVGIAGHLKIGDAVTVAAKSGVATDIPDQSTVIGSPAIPIMQGRRVYALQTMLPAIVDRLRKVEQAVDELSEQDEAGDKAKGE